MTPRDPVHRRYVRRVAIATACYVVTLALALRLVPGGKVAGPLAYLIGALPGFAVVGIFWSNWRLMIEMTDEYLRMLLVRQTLFASGFALSVTTVWGFLENVGLAPHIDGFYVAVLFLFGLGLGSLFNRLTLGDGGGW